jgi:hypothetical protein
LFITVSDPKSTLISRAQAHLQSAGALAVKCEVAKVVY